jgi:WD40 repeat protein/tetratricopeptide (TPR) repeat protein
MNNQPIRDGSRIRLWGVIFLVMIFVSATILYFKQAHNEYQNGMAEYESLHYSAANQHFQQVIGFYKLASSTNAAHAQQLVDTQIQPILDAEDKLRQGDYLGAVEDYKTFTNSHAESPHTEFVESQMAKTYLDWGEDLLQQHQYEDAIEKYLIISEQYGNLPSAQSISAKLVDAYMQWGNSLVQAGEYEDAIEKFTIVLTDYKTSNIVRSATTQLATAFLKWGDALAQSADYQGSIEKYRVVLHDYKDESIAQTALTNLVAAYDNLGQQLIEKKSFSTAMDAYVLANAFSTDSAMRAKFEAAYKTAFAELLTDAETDGQSVMGEALIMACNGKPGKSPVLGMSSDTLLGVQFCNNSEKVQLPEEWIAKTPGDFRYVVDIYFRETVFAPCSYTGGHTLQRTGEAKEIAIYDVRTGKRVDQKIYAGRPPICPETYLFSGNTDSIKGGVVVVSDEVMQKDLMGLLRPLMSAQAGTTTVQVIPDIPALPKGFLLPVSNTELDIDDNVTKVVFSPDGKLLASTTQNGTALWDVESGQIVREITGILSNDLAFTPDGALLAIGEADESTIGFWDVTTGEQTQTLDGFHGVIALSADGKLLASLASNEIRLWDIGNAKVVQTFEIDISQIVRCITFSPDGNWLAAGFANDNLVKVWEVVSGNEVWEQESPPKFYDTSFPGQVWGIAYSPDGKLLASGSGSGVINLWDASDGKMVRAFDGHSNSVLSLAFSPNGKLLASGAADNTIKFWDISNGNEVYSFDFSGYDTDAGLDTVIDNRRLVFSVAFSPDGKWFATGRSTSVVIVDSRGTYPNVLHLWKLEDPFAP